MLLCSRFFTADMQIVCWSAGMCFRHAMDYVSAGSSFQTFLTPADMLPDTSDWKVCSGADVFADMTSDPTFNTESVQIQNSHWNRGCGASHFIGLGGNNNERKGQKQTNRKKLRVLVWKVEVLLQWKSGNLRHFKCWSRWPEIRDRFTTWLNGRGFFLFKISFRWSDYLRYRATLLESLQSSNLYKVSLQSFKLLGAGHQLGELWHDQLIDVVPHWSANCSYLPRHIT